MRGPTLIPKTVSITVCALLTLPLPHTERRALKVGITFGIMGVSRHGSAHCPQCIPTGSGVWTVSVAEVSNNTCCPSVVWAVDKTVKVFTGQATVLTMLIVLTPKK